MDLSAYLLSQSRDGLISWGVQGMTAQMFGLSVAEVESAILNLGLLPARYQRNQRTLSTDNQRTLFQSKAVVIGCGGLGGYLIEELARLGVGSIVMCDPDIFEEHNLNRQLYSAPHLLGAAKVEAAAKRVGEINPAVTVAAYQLAFSESNGRELLDGANIVLDGLDSIPTRHMLAKLCQTMRIPLVYGAIGGWYGQVATQMPGDALLPHLNNASTDQNGIEKKAGNPPFTPAVIASIQVAEACKILLDKGGFLRNKMLCIDLREMMFEQISFAL